MSGVQQRVLPGRRPALAYDVAGDEHGRPLVLLHGLSANSTSWCPVIERTASGWRSHALDFRGHGRSDRTPGRYRLDDYLDDADRLLQVIGEPAVVIGHSLGAIVAAALAQDRHPLVAAVFLEDPPLYVVEPAVFAGSGLARGFAVLREHIERLQAERSAGRDLPGSASPRHRTQPAIVSATTSTTTPCGPGPGRSPRPTPRPSPPCSTARPSPATTPTGRCTAPRWSCGPTRPTTPPFAPTTSTAAPHLARTSSIVAMPGAGHNIRGDRATRDRYLDVLTDFLTHQPDPTMELQP